MKAKDLLLIVRRNLVRRRLRSVLTALGVALGVLLFVGVESFGAGLDRAITAGDRARTLIVYRENRYCPQTSMLPERYEDEIRGIPGVESVLPVKVFLNNCRTNLDMITFHGVPVDGLLAQHDVKLVDGDLERFRTEGDAAIVGRDFAARRGLEVGDKFRFGDIVVKVAGIFSSEDAVRESLIFTHLEFLQRSGGVRRLGTVTQFDVRVRDAAAAKGIAEEIDRRLATAEEPTHTRSMAEFLERATRDLREILRFGRVFGFVCVIVVLVLVANTVYLSAHERRRELGLFLALGFRGRSLASMVVAESLALGAIGAVLGLASAAVLLRLSGLAIGVEGVQVAFSLSPAVLLTGFSASLAAAALAAVVPAVQTARADVIESMRALT